MKLSVLTLVTVLAMPALAQAQKITCNSNVTLDMLEGNYEFTNGPAVIEIMGRVIPAPNAVASGPAAVVRNGNGVVLDTPVWANMSIELAVVSDGADEFDFTKWNVVEGDSIDPINGKDLGLALGCKGEVKTIRLHGTATVDMPDIGLQDMEMWLIAFPDRVITGRMDWATSAGGMVHTQIHMTRTGKLDYEALDMGPPKEADKSTVPDGPTEYDLEVMMFEDLDLLEETGQLDHLEDLGIIDRIRDMAPFYLPRLQDKVERLKEAGYLGEFTLNELIP